ncbi:uncharacterized protein G2W53_014217 [Senna tora]|uniref:Uncharacterized protein n=1 Tax=Senna tora TaxID=362788 RepID=A0A835C3T2_9FABA|nr:uncharacterized protein G2W53_014217 [Senna tora]
MSPIWGDIQNITDLIILPSHKSSSTSSHRVSTRKVMIFIDDAWEADSRQSPSNPDEKDSEAFLDALLMNLFLSSLSAFIGPNQRLLQFPLAVDNMLKSKVRYFPPIHQSSNCSLGPLSSLKVDIVLIHVENRSPSKKVYAFKSCPRSLFLIGSSNSFPLLRAKDFTISSKDESDLDEEGC